MDFNPKEMCISNWSSKPRSSSWSLHAVNGIMIYHKPTDLYVTCDKHRSAHLNKQACLDELEVLIPLAVEINEEAKTNRVLMPDELAALSSVESQLRSLHELSHTEVEVLVKALRRLL